MRTSTVHWLSCFSLTIPLSTLQGRTRPPSAITYLYGSSTNLASPARSLPAPTKPKRRNSSSSSKSALRKNGSFLEDGARDVLAPIEYGFPVPKKDQTLCEYLSSGDFNSFMSPLDKENNHFYIAEAIIQAIEQFNCTKGKRKQAPQRTGEYRPSVTLNSAKLPPPIGQSIE